MAEEHRNLLDEMLPLLKVIGEGHPDEFIQEMASDIRIAIATRGAVWSSFQESQKGKQQRSVSLSAFCQVDRGGGKLISFILHYFAVVFICVNIE
jgi:hypothetical protein